MENSFEGDYYDTFFDGYIEEDDKEYPEESKEVYDDVNPLLDEDEMDELYEKVMG